MTIHAGLAAGRWYKLNLAEQLANIGSEIERTIAAYQKTDRQRFERAFERALELIDLTLADERWQGPRRREISRIREEFGGLFGEKFAPSDDGAETKVFNSLRNEFLYYGILARANR